MHSLCIPLALMTIVHSAALAADEEHRERVDGCASAVAVDLPAGDATTLGPPCDDGSVIDVLVVYTAAARLAAGGQAKLEELISRAVDKANEVYVNSAIPLQVSLVHVAEVVYDENGTYPDHLERLRITDDGIMDDVHALRDTHAADMVSLFVAAGGSCGYAYRMVTISPLFESFAFSVVRWSCSISSLSFVHELAHNQGCCHAHNDACANPLFDDAFGHRFFGDGGTQFRTVMSGSPGTKIPNMSNPSVLHDGQPTGVPLGQPDPADNAATIAATALTVANFRCASAPCTGDLDGSGDVGFSDILQVIGAWGPCAACPEDVDGSGDVGFGDILALIGAWGPC